MKGWGVGGDGGTDPLGGVLLATAGVAGLLQVPGDLPIPDPRRVAPAALTETFGLCRYAIPGMEWQVVQITVE